MQDCSSSGDITGAADPSEVFLVRGGEIDPARLSRELIHLTTHSYDAMTRIKMTHAQLWTPLLYSIG